MVSLQSWLSPPKAAKLLGVSPEKIVGWILAGELKASNVATNPRGKRPRYRIDPQEFIDFMRRRAAVPEPAPKVKRHPFAHKASNEPTYF